LRRATDQHDQKHASADTSVLVGSARAEPSRFADMLALPALPLARPALDSSTSTTARGNRALDCLRPLKLRTGVVDSADGSALIELANTKVVCSVFGPQPAESREYMEQGHLDCSLKLASFARRPRLQGRAAVTEERALSLDLAAALSASVQLHLLPKSVVAVHTLVLQDDGGALPAAISCASLALADAGIALYGLVAACGCSVLDDAIALDCSAAEASVATGSVSVACMPTLEQLTLLRHEGTMPFARATEGLKLALQGCAMLHDEMATTLRAGVAAREAQTAVDAAKGAPTAGKRARSEAEGTAGGAQEPMVL